MSVAAQTLSPPSKTLMLLEGRRAFHELGAFFGALPLLSLAPAGDGHPVLVLPGLVASDVSTQAAAHVPENARLCRLRLAVRPQSRSA